MRREAGQDERVECIDLVVPFEGSADSGFWVNTQALLISGSVLITGMMKNFPFESSIEKGIALVRLDGAFLIDCNK